jgi:hypothetical protein
MPQSATRCTVRPSFRFTAFLEVLEMSGAVFRVVYSGNGRKLRNTRAWEAAALPLSYTRKVLILCQQLGSGRNLSNMHQRWKSNTVNAGSD